MIMGKVRDMAGKIGNKLGDKIANLSELSPEQIEKVLLKREEYLLQKPDPSDYMALEKTGRMMAASSIEIYNAHLSQIKDLYLPINNTTIYGKEFDDRANIRYYNITKWVNDRKENNLEKLVNTYAVLSDENCNIALVFNRTVKHVNVYLAVVNLANDSDNTSVRNYSDRLISAIRGNFPGAQFGHERVGKIECLDNDKKYSVACASNIPAEKSEKYISQTIEKLLDAIIPESSAQEYTLVLLATPALNVEERKSKLAEFHSGLTPYAAWTTDYHYTEASARGSSATVGVNVGASAGIQNGQSTSSTRNNGVTKNESQTDTESNSDCIMQSEGETISDSNSKSTTRNKSTTINKGITKSVNNGKSITGGAGANAGANLNLGPLNLNLGASGSLSTSSSHGISIGRVSSTAKSYGEAATKAMTHCIANTVTKSTSETTGRAVANTIGKAVTSSMANTVGLAKSVSFGGNFGANFARSSTVTATIGKNEGITQNYANYNIKHALELLESQMKRLDQSSALGMWDFAAYVVSEDVNIANNVAHTYLALTIGEESYMSKTAINLWRGRDEYKEGKVEQEEASIICDYIRQLRHPVFLMSPEIIDEDNTYNVYPSVVTATTCLSGKELAYSLNFPQKSVAGFPVLECAEFGRNISTFEMYDNRPDTQIKLGKIFHMHSIETVDVNLSLNSLASHTFITGSTGSGKSNTIYHILNSARREGTHFLVVEPAKGEYKNVFGKDEDVCVYGTNPKLSALLRINPFSFPEQIHILEHLDRLVELFNVCWPMYAAMPAVLKSAVEKSYVDCGWDLMSSTNKYDKNIYPDFVDVARNIKYIIDSSEYDTENKGAYKGSLLTRLHSLTTGINGLIFSADELTGEELFEQNVIVDLSRVGSSETKSLIMGMLVLKLQEFRMTNDISMNASMRHITVLEEAHNLLRRTSIEQPTESSNILGKSVEMLANAIAEMRTYGEGFIIADQAPGLMDMSVIRNTNTKIIMRLPDQSDRELVGKAANLNDDQIRELAMLPCGVGAVYQNEWIQPVLCKIEKYEGDFSSYSFDASKNEVLFNKDSELSDSLLKCIMDKELFQKGDKEDLRELKNLVIRSRLNSLVKIDFLDYIETEKGKGMEELSCLIYDFLNAEEAIESAKEYGDIHEWVDAVVDQLQPSVKDYSQKQLNLTIMLILHEQMVRDCLYKNRLNIFIEEYRRGGGLF